MHVLMLPHILSFCPWSLSLISLLSWSNSTTSLHSLRPAPTSPPLSPPRELLTCAQSPTSGWPSPWIPAAAPSRRHPLPPLLPLCHPTTPTPDPRDPPSPPPPHPSETSLPRADPSPLSHTAPQPLLPPRLTVISPTPLRCLPPPQLSTATEAKVCLKYNQKRTQLAFCPQQSHRQHPKVLLLCCTKLPLWNPQKRSLL